MLQIDGACESNFRNFLSNPLRIVGITRRLNENLAVPNLEKLGLEDGSIPDESLSASSNWKDVDMSTPAGGRLNKVSPFGIIGAWCPVVKDTNQWIQVDLGDPTYVTGVLTQGRQDFPQWVTKYTVQFKPPSPSDLVDVKDKHGETQVC